MPDAQAMPLIDAVSRAVTAEDLGQRYAQLKRALVACWAPLSMSDRLAFLARLADDDLSFMRMTSDDTLRREAALLWVLERWDDVLPGLTGAEREFAEDIAKRRRWKNWKPSDKQVDWIHGIWAAHSEPEESVTE